MIACEDESLHGNLQSETKRVKFCIKKAYNCLQINGFRWPNR